ncbi:MAG: hypothetical protein JNL38_33045 [Myxococcales bacterium]|nr:hypothetical protein [Myxococcales bacterium]
MPSRRARARRLPFCVALVSVAAACALLGAVGEARADDATVSVNGQFADPPPQRRVVVSADDAFIAREPELRRSVVRFELGPVGLTSGKGFGYGLQTGISLGTGSVGGRFYAAWMRGEGGDDNHRGAATGESLGQYGGELVLDLHKRGPWHPIVAMGVAFAHVGKPDGSGNAGLGTGRLGLEYALNLDDADVRFGIGVQGALVGPRDDEIKDLRAYAIGGLHAAVGF